MGLKAEYRAGKGKLLREVDQKGEVEIRGKYQARVAMRLINEGELELTWSRITSMGGVGVVRRRRPKFSWRDAMRHKPEVA